MFFAALHTTPRDESPNPLGTSFDSPSERGSVPATPLTPAAPVGDCALPSFRRSLRNWMFGEGRDCDPSFFRSTLACAHGFRAPARFAPSR
jgi:hypothetical protein